MIFWKYIIVHHTASKDTNLLNVGEVWNYHVVERGWSDVGYQFLMDLINGEYHAIVGRPLTRSGSHAKGWNSKAIGVAVIGNYSVATPVEDQYRILGSRIIRPLRQTFGIELANVLGHRDVAATECPGNNFSMTALREFC